MLSHEYVKEQSDTAEALAEKIFKRMGLNPKRVDFQGRNRRKRPEFVVEKAPEQPVVICEVKASLSGDYDKEEDMRISTGDRKTFDRGPFTYRVKFGTIYERLASAVEKRRVLLEEQPSLVDVRLVVAFRFDPFAHRPREQCTVGALRTEAADVDVSVRARGTANTQRGTGPVSVNAITVTS